MSIFTTDLNNLRELYLDTIKRTLSSERQIADKGLPAMIEKATNPQLADALRTHLVETRHHIVRLERILDAAAGEADDIRCKVTAALLSSAESSISGVSNDALRDVVLIAAGNQVEHHEIAVYGTLRRWAEFLNLTEDARIIKSIEAEEIKADQKLTEVANKVNIMAPATV